MDTEKFVIKFPHTEKPIIPSMILPLACLMDISNRCKDKKLRKVLRDEVQRTTGKVTFEEVVIEWRNFDFPIIPAFEKEYKRRGG